MSTDLADYVAIVTGGGRGIGRAIALGYAQAGADVVISSAQNISEAEAVAAESADLRGTIHAIQSDVTAAADVGRCLAPRAARGARRPGLPIRQRPPHSLGGHRHLP